MKKKILIFLIILVNNVMLLSKLVPRVKFDDQKLQDTLSPLEYKITQKMGLEQPKKGAYYKHNLVGTYACRVCDETLFDSAHKYNNINGYAAFSIAIGDVIETRTSQFRMRPELKCVNCASHLGMIWDDGQKHIKSADAKYRIYSASIRFEPTPLNLIPDGYIENQTPPQPEEKKKKKH